MNIFSAPLFSLFSVRFYRQAVQSPLTKGFAYLTYLSALAAFAFAVLFQIYGRPEFRGLTHWLEGNLPPLSYSPEGLTMNAPSPQTIVNPKYGLSITFDMNKETVTSEEMGSSMIFVTSKNLYVLPRRDPMRIYSLVRPGQTGNPVPVNEVLKKTFETIDQVIVFVIFFAAFPIFFIGELFAAVFYSLIGLLINLMRKERLSYPVLLNVSLFALTPVCLLQLLKLSFPSLPLPLGFGASLFLTTIYLFLGIRLTEEKGFSS